MECPSATRLALLSPDALLVRLLSAGDSMWADIAGGHYALGGSAQANGHAARQEDVKVKAFLERVAK